MLDYEKIIKDLTNWADGDSCNNCPCMDDTCYLAAEAIQNLLSNRNATNGDTKTMYCHLMTGSIVPDAEAAYYLYCGFGDCDTCPFHVGMELRDSCKQLFVGLFEQRYEFLGFEKVVVSIPEQKAKTDAKGYGCMSISREIQGIQDALVDAFAYTECLKRGVQRRNPHIVVSNGMSHKGELT